MNIFQIICLLLSIAAAITHLVFIYKNHKLGRQISKGFITGILLLYIVFSKEKSVFLYFGLIASFVGDILLLFKEKKIFFIFGAIAFSLAHISYFIVTTKVLPANFNWCYYGIVLLLGYLVVEFIRKYLKKSFGKLSIPAAIYFYLVGTVILNLLCGTLFNFSIVSFVALIGSLCFIASDIILSINYFIKKIKYGEFIIMLLYSLAQVLIVVPIIFV